MGIKKLNSTFSVHICLLDGMNADIENHIKIVPHALSFSKLYQQRKCIHHNIPGKLWKVLGVDMFTLNKKHYLSIADYHRKFLIIKKDEDLSRDSSIVACKIIFFRIWLAKENNVRCGWQFYFR